MEDASPTYHELSLKIASLEKLLSEKDSMIQQLQESEEKWKSVCLNSPSILAVFDLEGRILLINHTIPQVNKEEVIGTLFFDYAPDEERQPLRECLRKSIEGRQIEEYTLTYFTNSGERLYFDTRFNPYIVDGKVTCIICSATNVTAQIVAEQALFKSEENYRLIFDHMINGFQLNEVVYDENNQPVDSRILAVNKYFTDFSGLDFRNVVGKTIREVVPNVEDEIIRRYNQVGITGEPLQLEYYSKAFNKYVRFLAYSPQKNQYACIYEDITPRKIAEKKLAELNEKLNSLMVDQNIILETAPLGISKLKDRKQIWVNQASEKILGYSRDEVIGRDTRFLYPTDEAYEKFGKEAYAEIAKGNIYKTVQELVCKDGEHKTISYIGKAIDCTDLSKGSIWLIEDITKQRKAEEALLEREARFREVLENSIDVSYKYNLLTETFDYISPVIFKMIGYSLDEFTAMAFEAILDHIHPEDRPAFKKIRARSISSIERTSFQIDYRFKHKEGHYIWIHNQFSIVRDSQGNPTGRIGSLSDITIRKKTEQALQHSQRQYEDLFEHAEASLTMLDYDGHYLMINDKSAENFGVPKTEIIGKSLFDFFSRDKAQKYLEQNRLIIDTDGRKEYEDTFLMNGEVRTYLVVDQCLKDENGRKYALLSSALDITSRKQAEIALEKSKRELEKVQEITKTGSWFLDLRTNKVLWNSELYKIYGVDESQPLELIDHQKLVTPQSSELLLKTINHTIRTGEPYEIELEIHKVGGEHGWMWTRGEVVRDPGGEIVSLWGVVQDITERKQAELIIYDQNLQLKKINAQKDKFFSIIAHDLRGPISTFLGFSDHMVNQLDNLTLKDIQKIAGGMSKSATNLIRLLENLLDWSRMEQGLMPFKPVNVFLLSLLNETLSMAGISAKTKDIELIYNIRLDLEVFADKNMIKTVVRNLLSNAIKYTPKGGKVILSAENAGNEYTKISIEDTGIGMTQKIIDNLFQLEVITNRKGTDGEHSTGLGLIICKDIIEMHGGRLIVESEEGRGSCFSFTLPMKKGEVVNQ